MKPKIIVPIRPKNFADARKQISAAAKKADVCEIWLDEILKTTPLEKVCELVKKCPRPTIVNLKDAAEKGKFRGKISERVEILTKIPADFVDLPLEISPALVKKFLTKSKAKLILSFHDFQKMPTLVELRRLARKAEARGADVVKLVGTARNSRDCLPIFAVSRELAERKKEFFAMAMGEAGELTRVLTPLVGGFGMFAPLDRKSATASGQISADELKKLWQRFEK